MNDRISELMAALRGIAVDERLSDEALAALSRCYVSMQNLVVADSLEAEYGSRREYERVLDALGEICRRRCASGQPFARRSRMLPVLSMIDDMQMRVVDMRRQDECRRMMFSAVDEWVHNDCRAEDEYGVLRCIATLFCYADEADRESDSDFVRFRSSIDSWAAELNGGCRWAGLPLRDALNRLEIMGRNSNMFLDSRYDAQIIEARTSYGRSVLEGTMRREAESSPVDGYTLCMLYEISAWGVGMPDTELADLAAEYSARMAEGYSAGSEDWLWCMSVVLDRECMRLNEEIQNRIFAHSA